MEYNQPSELIKELNFGDLAKSKIIAGVDKLAKAVKMLEATRSLQKTV